MHTRVPVVLAGLSALACASGPPAATRSTGAGACADFSGRWEIQTTVDKTGCGESVDTETVSVDMHQDGCALRLPISMTGTLSGDVVGQTVRLSGKERSLWTTEKALELTIDGDTLTGQGTWTWSMVGFSCGGTEVLQGRRR